MEKKDIEILETLKLKTGYNKKEEIFELDKFINRYNNINQYDDQMYQEMFKCLIENRLNLINENNPDFLYMLKILQTIRLLSRNQNNQNLLYQDKILNIFEFILEKLMNNTKSSNNNPNSEILDNLLIELISIIKRYFTSIAGEEKINEKDEIQNLHNEYLEKIINDTNLFDQMIFLLNKENIFILKLLHFIFISVLRKPEVMSKFAKTYTVENMIQSVRDRLQEYSKIFLDFLVILMENKEFRNLFMFLEGHLMIMNKLRNYDKIERDVLIKILYTLQVIYKTEDSLGDFINTSILNNLFTILTANTNDQQINKLILNIISAFALNDDLNYNIRTNYLESLFSLLVDYSFKLRENLKESDILQIITNQMLIGRILRLIFSLEKNRKYFKYILPTKILSIFIDIGNYKHNLSLYNQLIKEINSLSDQDLKDILKKSNEISNPKEGESQTIGGYTIIELIGKGGFGSVFKVKLGNQYFAMKEIKLDDKLYEKIKDEDISKGNNFIGEVDICKDLDHPNIIRFYTAFIEKEKRSAYIVLELVEGINLSEYIINLKEKNSSAKEKDILRILLDMICGLKYLHKEKKILYRDVNPHNILIDNNFNVKLCDFGLAIKQGNKYEHSNSTGFVGAILYSSPETVKNQNYIEKSDIWSLGCIIYELLMLSPAFNGDNPLTVARNIVELNYQRLNENNFQNKKLVEVVEKCLKINPDERPDIDEICDMFGSFFVEKINWIKKNEQDLKIENDILREKLFKLELALSNNINNNFNNMINMTSHAETNQFSETANLKRIQNTNYLQQTQLISPKVTESIFKQSSFKIISDPLTKIIDMINKILFLSDVHINTKDEKYIYITKFKKKLFNSRDNWNPNIVKNEIMKILNFSKEAINFEVEERFEPFNSTGMKPDYLKLRITYEIICHFIEELLILNRYYEK